MTDSTEAVAATPKVVVADRPGLAVASADLKQKTTRGGFVSVGGQAIKFILRTGSMVALARLLSPGDFGLIAMVTAFTGFLGLFKDAGLCSAAVQTQHVSTAQLTTLFWLNLVFGCALAAVTMIAAPAIAGFYGEPRLMGITIVLALTFVFAGSSAQHYAVLQRQMRFGLLATIEISALMLSIAVGVAMAAGGAGCWSLVGMALSLQAGNAVGLWCTAGWQPGLPLRGAPVGKMVKYGGTVSLNALVVYIAYNTEKLLLGRFFGAEVLGIYGRAYQLINIPVENLNASIGWVAFPALARVQHDRMRLRSYFLSGYRLFLAIVVPITTACALLAPEIVTVLLGASWSEAVPIFRLLAPSILAFALMNPFAWLMLSTGHARRSLNIACMIAPVVIIGICLGLSHGPRGVAFGYSCALTLLILPMITWAKRGTLISLFDVVAVVSRPLGASMLAATLTWLVEQQIPATALPIVRLIIASCVLFGAYAAVLLFAMKQWNFYLGVLRDAGLVRKNLA